MNNPTAHLIGVGPGDPDLIPFASTQLLKEADYVAGFKTVNNITEKWTGNSTEFIHLSYRDQEQGLNEAAAHAANGRKVVFTAWGDFSFSGHELVERIEKACSQHQVDLGYHPGISCIQIALSKAGLPAEDSLFLTLHRRYALSESQQELLDAVKSGNRHLFVLPHTFDLMPAEVARFLVESGISSDRPVTVMEKLTHTDEQITTGSLEEIAAIERDFSDLSIIVIPTS